MIGLDTNVLLRYLAQDDAKQAAQATRLIEQELSGSNPGFISAVVLVELCWVLTRLYEAGQTELVTMVSDLLDSQQFHLEHRDVVQATVRHIKQSKSKKIGFSDVLIAQLAQAQGCERTVTFDKAAARVAGMALLS